MEANTKIIEQMLNQYGVEASRDSKEAIVNFSVLFGEKMLRKCVQGRPASKKVTAEEIKQAYEMSKGLRSVEYEAELQERKKEAIAKINATKIIKEEQDDDRVQNAARSVMTVNFYNTDIYHMCLGKEHQLSYDLKNE